MAKLFRKFLKKKKRDDRRYTDDTLSTVNGANNDGITAAPPEETAVINEEKIPEEEEEIMTSSSTPRKSILHTSSTGVSVGSSGKRRSVTFSRSTISEEEEKKAEEELIDNNNNDDDPFPNHTNKRPEKLERSLSICSSKYNISGTGKLDKFEQLARSLDSQSRGSIDPQTVIQLLKEQDALRKRQWVLLFGNIIQWLPIIMGAVYTFVKFTERQYQQNVGGKILTSSDYIREGVVTMEEIENLWELSRGKSYPLTMEQKRDYLRDGFVVLPNFLSSNESLALDKVVTHNLNEMAFPDLLTKCSRKFHGEHYHSTVTHRFWQQDRIADMLSELALGGDTAYMVTSEILEMPSGVACIPQWHWDFLTFPQNYYASFTTGTQIWWSSEEVDGNVGGGLAFLPGSHKWANEVDDGAALHPCFAMNLFEKMSSECTQLLDREMVVPKLSPRDIVVFSRFTLHRSVARNPSVPFKSPTGRRGYTLRVGSARSIFKQDTMQCFPSHPSSNFERQLKEGKRYDSVIDPQTGLPHPHAVYRPMNVRDSEELIIQDEHARAMSTTTFLHYSAQSIIRQKIKWKLAKYIEDVVNGVARRKVLDCIMARTIRKAKKQSTDSSSASKKQKVESPLKPGDQVVFHNLNPDDDLHGKSGELVQYHDGKIKYWEVITEDDMLVDMEAKNLKRKDNEIAATQEQERKSMSCPTHVYVLILEEWNHGWGSGQESKVIGVYISKEAAVLASGDITTSYGTFDRAIEPNRGDFSGEFDHKDYRSNPPDDGILIQLGGDDIGEGDYIRLKIQKMPLL